MFRAGYCERFKAVRSFQRAMPFVGEQRNEQLAAGDVDHEACCHSKSITLFCSPFAQKGFSSSANCDRAAIRVILRCQITASAGAVGGVKRLTCSIIARNAP